MWDSLVCKVTRMFSLTKQQTANNVETIVLVSGLPASPRFCHGNSSNAFACNHLGDKAFNLFFSAIVGNVGHDYIWMKAEPWACTVNIHPGKKGEGKVQKKVLPKTWTLNLHHDNTETIMKRTPLHRSLRDLLPLFTELNFTAKWVHNLPGY